ncbi:hypothetical protein ACFQY5_37035 [Paeniroseomonas aquatica]|uniref:hypothetical protein n=1 Tax=Paeniroseomonas aquatica TaxID=373043 RepID=UPI003612D27F
MPLAPAHTDWLRNTLHVTGASGAVRRFQAAARGSGIIPWQRDLDRLEEDWFLPMAAPADGVRAISLAGARILARRLRDSVALQQQRALLRATTDQSCPFDLHRLLPVPPAILRLGPEDPRVGDGSGGTGVPPAPSAMSGCCPVRPIAATAGPITGWWSSGRPTGRPGRRSGPSAAPGRT